MKRRNFLKIFPTVTAAGAFTVNGHAMKAIGDYKLARLLGSCDGVEDRVLIMLQLKGGNDGINTFIPLNQYDRYHNIRSEIAIEQSKLINLDSTLGVDEQVGVQPAMTLFKEMYDNGKAAMVQGAGYDNMNQSHFKGINLWMSGGDSTQANSNLSTGWMGRALQAFYPDVHGVPTQDVPDPLGIQIGNSSPTLAFQTNTEYQNVINLSGQDVSGFYSFLQSIGGAPIQHVPDTEQGLELQYIMDIEQSTNLYGQRVSQVFNAGSNYLSSYPTTNNKNDLADQLRTIARLIKGGCKTKMYLCQHGSFDTHSAQVDSGDTTTGDHASLLLDMCEAVKYFLDDLEGLGLSDQVIVCTFSEFGRCAAGNGSFGTDHGTLAPMMLFGKNVRAGVQGTNVNLSNLTNDNQVQGLQFDYRQVFTSLLQDWLGASDSVLNDTMFLGYDKLPVVDGAFVVAPECYLPMTLATHDPNPATAVMQVFPNPAVAYSEVSFENSGSIFEARLSLHSLGGSLVSISTVLVNQGGNNYMLDLTALQPGPYFVRLESKVSGRAWVAKLSVL